MKTIFCLMPLVLVTACAPGSRKYAFETPPPRHDAAAVRESASAATPPAEQGMPAVIEAPVVAEATSTNIEESVAIAVAETNLFTDVIVTNTEAASPFARQPQQRIPPPETTATPPAPVVVPAPPTTVVAPPPGPAAPGPGLGAPPVISESRLATNPPPEEIHPAGMIDFRNAPLDDVLQVYAKFVGRTLLRPANLTGQGGPQITLQTVTPLTRSEVIQALDTVLGMNGIAMLKIDDKFVKVVPVAQAPTEGAPRDPREISELPDLGPYVTHVVQLKYVKPTEIVQSLTPFSKVPNSILAVDSSQILVIRDFTENVKRVLEMVKEIDVAVPSEFVSEVIPIKYAKASAIADALNSLSGSGGTTSIGGQSTTGTRGRSTGATTPGVRTGTGYNQPGQAQQLGSALPGQAGSPAGAGGSFQDRLQRIIQRASATGDLQILGTTKIIADERSNSLMIFASRQDMEMIKNVVGKLDVVLAQVLIETIIMDVQIGDTWQFGVTAGQPPRSNSVGTIGGVYNNSGSGSSSPLGVLNEFFSQAGISTTNGSSALFPSSSGLTYFGRYKGELDVVINAAASDSRINVIQKPRILTSHATPGSIFVGSTVPYVTSTYYGGGIGGGPSSSFQQLSVGIGLEVTPFINPDGLVVMTIDETIDEIAGATEIQGVGAVPNTTSRRISAEVAVRDGDTIILGGFIRNSSNKQNSGVPLLKDIPLLGALFTSRSDARERKELLVLMRPTVLKTPEIAALASAQEKKRLPGVSAAEAEVVEMERKELERERKRQLQQVKPRAKESQYLIE